VVIYRGATIGNNFFAHAHAVVREFCNLGDNVLLQNGVVVGSDGFGFAKIEEGDVTNKDDGHGWHKIVQSGNVVIESNAELQANTCIDRASIGETRIGRGAKIDNLVHVGHSCTIGHDTLLCAQVGLAGTTDVGNNVILAGQVGVSGHVKIGDGAIAIAQSGIPHDVAPGAMVSGAPAIDHRLWLKCCAAYAKLPEIAKAVRKLSERSESFLGTIPDPVNLAFRIPESLQLLRIAAQCAAAAPELTVISADITGAMPVGS